jgi:septal ring factor EnvC (AmiA/AmiB activator)
MKTFLASCFLILGLVYPSFAQEEESQGPETIVEDYSSMVSKSNSYEDYKIIKKESLESFKKRLTDEIKAFEDEISSLKTTISSQEKNINELSLSLKNTQERLDQVNEEKDSMFLFGTPMSKAVYQIILFSVIGVLVLLLVVVLVKFKANNLATKEAHYNLRDVEANFEEYKKRALETQQKLGRELQDYKNKLAKLKNP